MTRNNEEGKQKHRIPFIAKLAAVIVGGSLLSQGSIFGFVVFAALAYEFSKRDAEQPEETEGMALVGGMLWAGLVALGIFALGYFAFDDFLMKAEVQFPDWFSEMFSLQFADFYTGAVLGFLLLLSAPMLVVALLTGVKSRSPAAFLHRIASVAVSMGGLLVLSVLLAELGFALASQYQPSMVGLRAAVPWSVLSSQIATMFACFAFSLFGNVAFSKMGDLLGKDVAANGVAG